MQPQARIKLEGFDEKLWNILAIKKVANYTVHTLLITIAVAIAIATVSCNTAYIYQFS